MAMKLIVSRSASGRLLLVNRSLASISGLRFFNENIYQRWESERKQREKEEEERNFSERTVRTWSLFDTMNCYGHSMIPKESSSSFHRPWGWDGLSNTYSKPSNGHGSASMYGSLDGDYESSSSSTSGYGSSGSSSIWSRSSSTSYGSSGCDYGSSNSSSVDFGIGTSGDFDGSFGSD